MNSLQLYLNGLQLTHVIPPFSMIQQFAEKQTKFNMLTT